MPKLTKTFVDSLAIPESQPTFAWDDKVSGFGIKVLPSGKRKYVLKYRTHGGRSGRQRWLALGTHGPVTADQARVLAKSALATVAEGGDPQDNRQATATAPTLADVWSRYERDHLCLRKKSTQRNYETIWRDRVKPAFGKQRVQDITRGDVDAFHKRLSNIPYQANRILALLSKLMNLAEEWEWREGTNPCRHISKFREKPRQRFLTLSEIAEVRKASDRLAATGEITQSAANILELLLLTGARSGELASARWEWVDWDTQVIALPDSKTGEKTIYLSNSAIEVLREQYARSHDQEYIYPGRSAGKHIHNLRKPWARICQEAGLEGVRVHDLRHTAASLALGSGTSLAIVGRLLGHSQVQTTLRYAHLDTDPALQAANSIGDRIRPSAPIARDHKVSVEGDPSSR
ncbi:tyrosine-type recombinase/integrase [Qipengyuania spongiae]|uniref:Tyrosine-type recombinase/integrase n=1 Tax=Qipengyuania spongiae TaxID=2909673 RepID=A0ABY5SW73_9SPHN|nr:site-specific integrase [Qipengyuania spongiae]UVI38802.1 tyrosine-type recombinase/integrase [Qipengyuania spongiae]